MPNGFSTITRVQLPRPRFVRAGGLQLAEDVVEVVRRARDVEQTVAFVAAFAVEAVEFVRQPPVAVGVAELALMIEYVVGERPPQEVVVAAA